MGEPRSVTIEACPYADGSGAEFEIKVERDPKRGVMVAINGYTIWFEAEKWPAFREAVEEALRPFGYPKREPSVVEILTAAQPAPVK